MLHEIISKRKTGNNGSKGLMDYMLKESDKKTPRKGATVLRGDVETQAKLIDSLVGDFKQQYVCGCFSFEESPDEVTEEQKNEIMDGAEEIIRGGLDPDRVSITWIEHTDKINKETGKPRLELNYIVAQVDLKHGRQYQPYIHHRDMPLFNAFKDIQNIKHGFTEPDDPIKKQDYKQVKDLPQDVAELKKALTLHLHHMVAEGVINNREDIKKEFVNLGFEISRAGKNYISLKRPDGGQNIKFTSSKEGSLYDINFRPSATSAEEIRRASEEFNRNKPRRLREAHKVYAEASASKREYNEKRHNRKLSEHHQTYKRKRVVNSRASDDKQSEYNHSYTRDRDRNSTSSRLSPNPYQKTAIELDSSRINGFSNIRFGYVGWSRFNEINQQATTADLSILSRQKNSDKLPDTVKGLEHEQRTLRQGNSSSQRSAESNRDTRANDTTERTRYSSIERLVAQVGKNADSRTGTLAESIRELEEQDRRTEKSIQWMDDSTQGIARVNEQASERISSTMQRTKSTHREHEELSEYDNTARLFKERYGAIRGQIAGLERFTDKNNEEAELTRRAATELAKIASTIEIAREKQQQAQQQQQNSYRPRFR